jgi:hypothetical protein
MEDLPREMLNEILLKLDKPNLFQASNVCKLWRCQASTHVVTINDQYDLEIMAENGDRLSIIKSVCHHDWLDWGLDGACRGGHEDLVELMIDKGTTNFDDGLIAACEGGHKTLAKLMIAKGAIKINHGLYRASYRGFKELVELMVNNGADNFYDSLRIACLSGHKDLVKFMADEYHLLIKCGHCCKSAGEH